MASLAQLLGGGGFPEAVAQPATEEEAIQQKIDEIQRGLGEVGPEPKLSLLQRALAGVSGGLGQYAAGIARNPSLANTAVQDMIGRHRERVAKREAKLRTADLLKLQDLRGQQEALAKEEAATLGHTRRITEIETQGAERRKTLGVQDEQALVSEAKEKADKVLAAAADAELTDFQGVPITSLDLENDPSLRYAVRVATAAANRRRKKEDRPPKSLNQFDRQNMADARGIRNGFLNGETLKGEVVRQPAYELLKAGVQPEEIVADFRKEIEYIAFTEEEIDAEVEDFVISLAHIVQRVANEPKTEPEPEPTVAGSIDKWWESTKADRSLADRLGSLKDRLGIGVRSTPEPTDEERMSRLRNALENR